MNWKAILGFSLIGINNRNLKTFETNLQHSITLRKLIPDHIVSVSESGIHKPEDCDLLIQNDFHAILVGESLLKQPNPGYAIQQLLRKKPTAPHEKY